MLKTNKKCNVCILIRDGRNKSLLNRIYNSKYYMKTGESLIKIAEDYPDKFQYANLLNHCKKHQFLSEEDFTNRHLGGIVKKAEAQMMKRAIESTHVWDSIIDQGMESLESGGLTVTANHLLKAAKDKQDYQFKKKDQQLAMMEMVYHFASGENKQELSKPYDEAKLDEHNRQFIEGETLPDNNPPKGTPDSPGPGTNQPGGIHYPPAWNAAS